MCLFALTLKKYLFFKFNEFSPAWKSNANIFHACYFAKTLTDKNDQKESYFSFFLNMLTLSFQD